jgi:glycosyltransferase involved in cell wall biosynthesis
VVCSPDTAVREVAGDAAGLVAGDDPEAWAAALETMVFDEPARETARTAGLANAARYRWEKTAEAYLAAWQSHLAWPGVL